MTSAFGVKSRFDSSLVVSLDVPRLGIAGAPLVAFEGLAYTVYISLIFSSCLRLRSSSLRTCSSWYCLSRSLSISPCLIHAYAAPGSCC